MTDFIQNFKDRIAGSAGAHAAAPELIPIAGPIAIVAGAGIVYAVLALATIQLAPITLPIIAATVFYNARRDISKWCGANTAHPLRLHENAILGCHVQKVSQVAGLSEKDKEGLVTLSEPAAAQAAEKFRADMDVNAGNCVKSIQYTSIAALAVMMSPVLTHPVLALTAPGVALMAAAAAAIVLVERSSSRSVARTVIEVKSEIDRFEEASAGVPSLEDRVAALYAAQRSQPSQSKRAPDKTAAARPEVTPEIVREIVVEAMPSVDSAARRSPKP